MVLNANDDRFDSCSYRIYASPSMYSANSTIEVKFNKLTNVEAYVSTGVSFKPTWIKDSLHSEPIKENDQFSVIIAPNTELLLTLVPV